MSVTYTDDVSRNTSLQSETFVPRYARAKRARKSVRTWMILAPIGGAVLIGSGAVMLMAGGAPSQPLVEPATTAPVVQPLATVPVPPESSEAPANMALAPVMTAPAPVVRQAAVPAARLVEPATPVAASVDEAQTAGPRPYTAELNSAAPSVVVETPAPVVQAPAIQTAPLT